MRDLTVKRTIALFELFKGVLVLIAYLVVKDKELLHLSEYLAKSFNPHTLSFISKLAGIYICLRFIEAYGLWNNTRWGSTFAVISISAYIPFEIFEFMRTPNLLKFLIIIFNLGLLFYLWKGFKRIVI